LVSRIDGKLDPGTKKSPNDWEIAKGEIKMRIMTLVLASALTVFLAGGQADAAKRASGVGNPDHNSYQSAAGSCGGSASCYKSGAKKKK
jgi:hypothetical protein